MASSIPVSFTQREWDLMVEYYRSDDVDKLKEAVAILAAWRARMGDSLHVAAEMTELLLRAIILDYEIDPRDWFRLGYLRIVYGTVIIRIVNYANEIGQSTTPLLQSVADAAKKLGIPNWVVQVRHAAAHHYLPSVTLFRKAASFCRSWLWDIHWGKPVREAMDAVIESETITPCEEAINLIVSYIVFRMKNPKKRITDEEIRTEGVVHEIYKFVSADVSNFVQAFLFDGHLIMTDEQMNIAGFAVEDGNEIWIIPPDLQLFWEPVLRLLSQLNALPELLCQSISALNDPHLRKSKERQLVAWADYMLTAFSKTDSISQSDWKRIMKALISVAVPFKSEHYTMVMSKISFIASKKRKQLRRLLDISLNSSTMSDINAPSFGNGHTIKTLEDLRKCIDVGIDGAISEDPVTGEENWIVCDPAVWRGIPLGLTPEQSAESLCLILDKDYI